MKLSRQDKLFWLVLLVLILTTIFVLGYWKNLNQSYKKGASVEFDDAVVAATDLFRARANEINLANGPCLSNDLRPGWVVDIVHNPRGDLDNLPENQCQAYLEGRARHFVELDQSGNVVRVK